MSEKLCPPTKKVARADGLKRGTANTTTTTPSMKEDGGQAWGKGKGSSDSIMGK